jgi:hypothetical protein
LIVEQHDQFPSSDGIPASLIGSPRLARAVALGVPSFMRRAQAIDRALEKLHGAIRAERAARLERLLPIRARLGSVRPAPAALPEAAIRILNALREEPPPAPGFSRPCRSVSCEVKALLKLAERFNAGWTDYLAAVSLDDVWRAQEKYNRYYAIEREMALPNAPPIQFKPVPLFDRRDLFARYPGLPEATSPDAIG